jgi:methionyl-tRNA formyltransferase
MLCMLRLMRIIFMGTAPLARTILEALAQQPDFDIAAIVTQPDRPKGRDLKPQPSAVKAAALQRNLPVLQPERARNPEFIEQLRQLQAGLIVVAAYGQILPQAILDLPRFGCLNVHTSLLPKYRGAAPIQWAILEDESETGVTIMNMDAGLDTGGILTEARTPIHPQDNAQTLHDRLAQLGGDLLVRTIPDYVAGRIVPRPQPADGVSYARKIAKEDGSVDWNQPARAIWNRVRAFVPWPGAFTHLPGPKPLMLKLWEAEVVNRAGQPGEILAVEKHDLVIACGHNALRILTLQLEGKRKMRTQEFLAGHPIKAGERL